MNHTKNGTDDRETRLLGLIVARDKLKKQLPLLSRESVTPPVLMNIRDESTRNFFFKLKTTKTAD